MPLGNGKSPMRHYRSDSAFEILPKWTRQRIGDENNNKYLFHFLFFQKEYCNISE